MKTTPLIYLLLSLSFISCSTPHVPASRQAPRAIFPFAKVLLLPFQNDYPDIKEKLQKTFEKGATKTNRAITFTDNKMVENYLEQEKLTSHLLTPRMLLRLGRKFQSDIAIAGSLTDPILSDKRYFVDKTVCQKEQCWQQKVLCEQRTIKLSVYFNAVDIQTPKQLFRDTLTKERVWVHCADDSKELPSLYEGSSELIAETVQTFTKKLSLK